MAVVVVGLDENPINRIMAAEQRMSMGHHRATKPPHPAPLPPLHRMTAALLFLVSFTAAPAAAENTKEAAYQSGRNTVDDDDDYFPPTIHHHPLS